MKNIELKKCSSCGETKGVEDFPKNKSIKQCKNCRKIKQKKYREKRKQKDTAYYFLETSCQNAYKRGQPDYKIDGYGHVDCEWNSPKEMFVYLKGDNDFYDAWQKQTDIYLITKDNNDKPSIDRIDSSKGYVSGNLQCLSLGKNKAKGGGIECNMLVIYQRKILLIRTYDSKKEAFDDFEARYGFTIPYNVFNQFIDDGKIHSVGQEYSILMQTKSGKKPEYAEKNYTLIIEHRRYSIDEEKGTEELIQKVQHQIPVGYLSLDKKNSEVWPTIA